jgi:hypothetical protein
MDEMGMVIGKAVLGAVAGAIIGVFVLALLYRIQPPVELKVFLVAICLGAILGSAIAATVGNRSVPVFWLYLVLIFGIITIIPWWYYEKTDTYLPLGTVYVNSPNREIMLFVLLPHTLTSIAWAGVATVVHNKFLARSAKQVETVASNGREEVIRILQEVVEVLEKPGTDVAWSSYNSLEEAVGDICQHIERLRRSDLSKIGDITLLFAPTGSLQEISISNEWGEGFLLLGARFDRAVESIRRG